MIRRSARFLLLAWMCFASCGRGAPGARSARPGPPASAGHALVFHDSLRSVLLLNAGLGGTGSPPESTRSRIWRWTGTDWVVLDSLGPPIRNLGGVAYDSHRDMIVVYGGSYDLDHVYDDTWEWDRRGGWQRKDVSGPGKRDHTQMAYDVERRRVVLFGGQIGIDSFPSGTWTYDGTKWEPWPQSDGPQPRVHHALTYDPTSRRVLLFGGFSPPNIPLGDTWSWSGTRWSQAAPAREPRTHASLVATARGVALLGGFPARESPSVPLLDGRVWESEDQPDNPGARFLTAAAFDPRRGVTVLFGGAGGPQGSDLYSDTWEFDRAGVWRKIP